MAGADSTVAVRVTGDSKSLQRALGSAESSVSSFGKSALKVGGVLAGAAVAGEVVDFAQTALSEFDRLGDATARLEDQLGTLSGPLIANAGNFAKLGQSAQDMLELEARVADIGTAAGISDQALAPMAQSAAETAAALSLITDMDAQTAVELIGKASAGASKPLQTLGINLTDAEVAARAMRDTGKGSAESLTENELAAARMALILEKLAPRIQDVVTGEGDMEQKQAELQAKFETLTGKIGEHLEGPLSDFLDWIISGIDGLGRLDEFVAMVGDAIGRFADDVRKALGPLFDFLGVIGDILGTLGRLPGDIAAGVSGVFGGGGGTVNLNVQGGSPEVVQQAVYGAYNTITNQGGFGQ